MIWDELGYEKGADGHSSWHSQKEQIGKDDTPTFLWNRKAQNPKSSTQNARILNQR